MAKLDFLIIGSEPDILKRGQEISAEFGYVYTSVPNLDVFMDNEKEYRDAAFILISAENIEKDSEIAGYVQVARQIAPTAYLVVSIDSKLDPAVSIFVKKSGVDLVIVASEVKETSKFEFIVSQKVGAAYLPVKTTELVENSAIGCSLFHLMPLNHKYLPVILAGDTISADRLLKLKQKGIGEVYVRSEDIEHFQKYTEKYGDASAQSMATRCRAQFLSLMKSYVDLILLVSDQSEKASFALGAALFKKCERLSSELMTTLGAAGEAWEIINNSAIGGFGSVERGPAIAAYAGLLSLMCSIGEPTEVMTAALIADIGMLDLSPGITKKIRHGGPGSLTGEDLKEYKNHPTVSLNQALSQRLQIPESTKTIILSTHERYDKTGFPNAPVPERIPMEAMLIQICELVDRASLIRMGQVRPEIKEVKQKIFDEQMAAGGAFSLAMLMKVKSQFVNG